MLPGMIIYTALAAPSRSVYSARSKWPCAWYASPAKQYTSI